MLANKCEKSFVLKSTFLYCVNLITLIVHSEQKGLKKTHSKRAQIQISKTGVEDLCMTTLTSKCTYLAENKLVNTFPCPAHEGITA